jgi:hypothetical protein
MEPAGLEVQNHSARARMELRLNGSVLNISHLGPDFLILAQPVDHPPAEAEIVMSVDGKQSRWSIRLPAGLSAECARTSILPCPQIGGRTVPPRATASAGVEWGLGGKTVGLSDRGSLSQRKTIPQFGDGLANPATDVALSPRRLEPSGWPAEPPVARAR